MTTVACFCGCCFSFSGDAGRCPECGEKVSFTPGLSEDEDRKADNLRVMPAEAPEAESEAA